MRDFCGAAGAHVGSHLACCSELRSLCMKGSGIASGEAGMSVQTKSAEVDLGGSEAS